MKTERKRMIAILLSLMMIFTMIPSMAFAESGGERSINAEDSPSAYDYDQTPAEEVTVTVTLSNDGIPLQGTDGTSISHLEITVPYFDLANYGLEEYYRYETDGDSGDYISDKVVQRPTVMHLYLYLLERYYMGISHEEFLDWENKEDVMSYGGPESGIVNYFDEEEAYSVGNHSAITITGGATSTFLTAFFGHDCNLMYYRNHKYPLMMKNWGATSDYMLLSEGDDIDIAMYSNWDFYGNGNFLAFGKETYTEDDATEGQLTVATYATTTAGVMSGADSPVEPCDGSLYPYVELYDSQWQKVKEIGEGITDNEDGTYTVTLPETAGTYYLIAMDANGGTDSAACAPATAKVIVGDASGGGSEPEQGDDDEEALTQVKTAAKSELAGYVKEADYREAEWAEVEQAISAGNEAIDAAADAEGVATALAAAKEAIDAIKTDAELTEEEDQAAAQAAAKALAEAKTAAENEIKEYKKASDYRESQQAELTAAINAANTAIDAAATVEAVQKAVADAKAAIDAIKTDAQLTEEENEAATQAAAKALAEAKTAAKKEIAAYKKASDYREAQQAELTAAIDAANTAIDAAATVEAVQKAVADAKAAMGKIKTDAQLTAEEQAAKPKPEPTPEPTPEPEPVPAPIPAEGTVVKDTGNTAKYEVTESERGGVEVAYTAPVNKKKTTVTIPATVTLADGTTAEVTSIDAKAFKNNKKVKEVTVGKNVETIGKEAFAGATKLTTVKLGTEVESIGSKAFSGCKKLTSVSMGKNVETIGNSAFAKCTSLKSVTLPADVEKIGAKAFYGDKKLKKITIKSKKLTSAKVGKQAFKGVYSKAKVDVPNKKVKAYKKFFYKKGLSKKAKIS